MPRRNRRRTYATPNLMENVEYHKVSKDWKIRYYETLEVNFEEMHIPTAPVHVYKSHHGFMHITCGNPHTVNHRCDLCQEPVPKWLKTYAIVYGFTKDIM